MLGLGRIPHLAFDLIAISTILAGIRRSSGFAYVPYTMRQFRVGRVSLLTSLFSCSFDMDLVHGSTVRALLKSYLGLGETVYGMINSFVVNSRYFKRTLK